MGSNDEEKRLNTISLDGETVSFVDGETIYEIATRSRKNIPTLCYDSRLDAFGGCRLCVVELEGSRNPVASCTTEGDARHRRANGDGENREIPKNTA